MFAVKVDEDLPIALTDRVNAQGYDAVRVIEQNMGGWKDPALWQAVQQEGRFLLTADKGFGDTHFHPPGTHAGLLVFRPDEDGIRPLLELAQQTLAQYDLAELAGTVTVVSPRGIRIRRAPEPPGGAEPAE